MILQSFPEPGLHGRIQFLVNFMERTQTKTAVISNIRILSSLTVPIQHIYIVP